MNVSRENFNRERLDLFWKFIYERQNIWYKRFVEKLPQPWTDDSVMRAERFTNVYRELDPGTQYAINQILERNAPKPDKIFNIMIYRLIGRSDTHKALGFQRLDNFNPVEMERILKEIRNSGKPPFTAAYMVGAYIKMGTNDKIENIVRLFAKLHENFGSFYDQIKSCKKPEEVYRVLNSSYGFGRFLAYQVLVDLLYPLKVYENKPLLPFSHDDWAVAGPGAKRGISIISKEGKGLEDVDIMNWLRSNQHGEFRRLGLDFKYSTDEHDKQIDLSLANIQNCLCEFHKYIKIKEGKGRGRRKFTMTNNLIKA